MSIENALEDHARATPEHGATETTCAEIPAPAAGTPPTGNRTTQRWLIALSYWAATLVDGAARIIVPIYLASLGMSASLIGLAFLFYEAFGLASNVYSGFLVNRFGYRKALLGSLGLHTLASTGYILIAPNQAVWLSLLLVNALRAMRGAGKEVIKTTSSAYLKQFGPTTKSAQRAAIQVLLGGKDAVKGVGLLTGGLLLSAVGFRLSFVALGLLTLACAVAAFAMVQDYREPTRVPIVSFADVRPKMAWLAWSRALLYAGRDLWLVLPVPLYLLDAGYEEIDIAVVLAFGLILLGVAQPLAGVQVKKRWEVAGRKWKSSWRYRPLLAAAPLSLVAVAGYAWLRADDPTHVVIAILVFNFLVGVATVPHNHLHVKYARRNRSAVDIAYYKSVAQLGKVLSVPISGVVYNYFDLRGCLVLTVACLGACVGVGAYSNRLFDPATPEIDVTG